MEAACGDYLTPRRYTSRAETAGGRRIFLVEDESLIAMRLVAELEDFIWKVIGPASMAEEALRLLANGPPPDAALLDVNLRDAPVYPVAQKLTELGVPFAFCTGYDTADQRWRFPGTPVLRKPVKVPECGFRNSARQ